MTTIHTISNMAYQPSHPSAQPFHAMAPTEDSNAQAPPLPPAHRHPVGIHADGNYSQMQAQRKYSQHPNNYSNYSAPGVTPGTPAASGGINGMALGVALSHERESGVQAMETPADRASLRERTPSDTPFADQYASDQPTPPRPVHPQPSYRLGGPLSAGAAAPAGTWSNNSSQQSVTLYSPSNVYPYSDFSRRAADPATSRVGTALYDPLPSRAAAVPVATAAPPAAVPADEEPGVPSRLPEPKGTNDRRFCCVSDMPQSSSSATSFGLIWPICGARFRFEDE